MIVIVVVGMLGIIFNSEQCLIFVDQQMCIDMQFNLEYVNESDSWGLRV